ncbi:hemophore-related protein [Mycolicibacterium lutetiense]
MELAPVKLAVAGGALALALSAGAGIASADPNLDPIVNTTCSYPQVMAAANAQDPAAAAQFDADPTSQSYLRQFLAAPRDQRQQMAQLILSSNGQYLGLMQQIFGSCSKY